MKKMKNFPIEKLLPKKGTISSYIFENEFINLPKTLFYKIVIELEPLDVSTLWEENPIKNYQTKIHLDFIRLPISDLQNIENQTFTFPINPEKGYIDGSIYLFDVHNPIDTNCITFGTFKKECIDAKITLLIDFEFEGTGFATTKFIDIETTLYVENTTIEDL
jgi:hypothetical protein